MPPTRRHFIPLLLAAIAACAEDTSSTADIPVQIEDSAGVRIVTHQGTPPGKTAFHLAAEPRYRHGADPGGYTFQEVSIGRLLPDGTAVVFDPWINELVVLDRDGANYRGRGGRRARGGRERRRSLRTLARQNPGG